MAKDAFDPSLYTRAPIFNLPTGISLTRTLLDDSPKTLGSIVKKARKNLEEALASSQKALADRQREQNALSGEDPRDIDQEADALWSALRMRGEPSTGIWVRREGRYRPRARPGRQGDVGLRSVEAPPAGMN